MAKKRNKKTNKKKRSKRESGRRRLFRILSLDGGGIRGVMTAWWLMQLEKRLGTPAADCFDLIAGTSTGAILGSALSRREPAASIVDLYRTRGREIFPSTAGRLWDRLGRTFSQGISAPKYSDDGLESALRRTLRDTTLGDLDTSPRLLITTYNTITRQAVVLKSWKPEHARVPLWEAAKASCSAPTFFPAHVTDMLGANAPLIDGGVVANNPAGCAIAEGVKLNRGRGAIPLSRFVVASFGTGESTRPITMKQAQEWGAVEWAIPVISVLMDGAADATHYIARQLIVPDQYVRLDTRLDKAFDDLDDASTTNIEALLNLAQDYLRSGGGNAELDRAAALVQR